MLADPLCSNHEIYTTLAPPLLARCNNTPDKQISGCGKNYNVTWFNQCYRSVVREYVLRVLGKSSTILHFLSNFLTIKWMIDSAHPVWIGSVRFINAIIHFIKMSWRFTRRRKIFRLEPNPFDEYLSIADGLSVEIKCFLTIWASLRWRFFLERNSSELSILKKLSFDKQDVANVCRLGDPGRGWFRYSRKNSIKLKCKSAELSGASVNILSHRPF